MLDHRDVIGLRMDFDDQFEYAKYNTGDVYLYTGENPNIKANTPMIVLRPAVEKENVLVGYIDQRKNKVTRLILSNSLQEPVSIVADEVGQ